MDLEQKPGRENAALGILGALLGALLSVLLCAGCAVLILLLGDTSIYNPYFAVLGGAASAVFTLRGCQKSSETAGKKDTVLSCMIVVVAAYCAYHTSTAIVLAQKTGMSFPNAFLSIPKLLRLGSLNAAAFAGNLALLYFFAVLGAAPAVLRVFSPPASGHFPQKTAPEKELPPEAEFFPPDRHLTYKPFWGNLGIAFLFASGALLLLESGGSSALLAFTAIALLLCALFICTDAIGYWMDATFLFVRAGDTLWYIDLLRLNMLSDCRFTDSRLTGRMAVRWHKLSPEKQEQAKKAALKKITEISPAGASPCDRPLNTAVLALPELAIKGETKWAWKGFFLGYGGRRCRLVIHKSYLNLVPAPDCRPAQQPLPFRWHVIALSLVFVLLLGGLGLAIDHSGSRPAQPGTPDAGISAPAAPPSGPTAQP